MHKFFKHFISFFIPLLFLSCAPKYTHTTQSFNGKLPSTHQIPPTTQITKTIYIDAKFTTEERRLIRDASFQWPYLSNKRIMYNLIYDYEVPDHNTIENKFVIVDLAPNDPLVAKFDDLYNGRFQVGYSKKDKAEFIFTCPNRTNSLEFYQGIQRALGKELGLEYTYEVGIMNELGTNYNVECPTRADMLEFCRVFLCSIEEVRYCYVAGP